MPSIGQRGKINLLTEDIKFIKDNYASMTNKQIADHFKLKLQKTRDLLYELGFKRMNLEYWTDDQVKFLEENFQEIGDLELAKIFEDKWPKNKMWTLKHIEKKRNHMHLHRTKIELSKIKERNVLSGAWLTGKTWKTRGESSIGTIKIWKSNFGNYYPVIKTENGFVHYYRWLWIKNFGDLKNDQLVVPKIGLPKTELFTIEQLEIIDRSEHARRNSQIRKNTPAEVKEIMKLIRKLKEKISSHEER